MIYFLSTHNDAYCRSTNVGYNIIFIFILNFDFFTNFKMNKYLLLN